MLRPATVNLVMADDEFEVSQVIPMGKHTGVDVNAAVHNCYAVLPLSGLTGLPIGWRANIATGAVGPE